MCGGLKDLDSLEGFNKKDSLLDSWFYSEDIVENCLSSIKCCEVPIFLLKYSENRVWNLEHVGNLFFPKVCDSLQRRHMLVMACVKQ